MKTTVGFIGTGNMGSALAKAVAKAIPSQEIYLYDKCAEKADAVASSFNQVFGGGESTGIVINHYAVSDYVSADAVEKYDGATIFHHFMKMVVASSLFCL